VLLLFEGCVLVAEISMFSSMFFVLYVTFLTGVIFTSNNIKCPLSLVILLCDHLCGCPFVGIYFDKVVL